jgi:hypothetical protein
MCDGPVGLQWNKIYNMCDGPIGLQHNRIYNMCCHQRGTKTLSRTHRY